MNNIKIIKRTFEALSYPEGSVERIKLNEDSVTSEYQTSYRYLVVGGNQEFHMFRTKQEAEEYIK